MAKYKCVKCGKEIDELIMGSVRCPQCSFRVLEKIRSAVVKEVLAR